MLKSLNPILPATALSQAIKDKYGNFADLTKDEEKKAWKEWDDVDSLFPLKLATVADVVDHIDHIVKVAGIDHVGIGTDFDGGGGLADCRDVSQMGNITLELVKAWLYGRRYPENMGRKY